VLDKNNLGKYGGPIRCPAMSLPEQPGTDQVLQTLNIAPESQPALGHNHSTPLYWKSAAGEFVYFWAEEDRLRQYKVENGRLTLFKTGTVRAPDEGPGGNGTPRYTMPGGTLALSANGGTGGIVWVTIPTSESANNKVVAGTMYAFDASDVSKQLWNSQMNDRDDFTNYAKFNPVTVSNGKVYVPTFKSADGQNQFCVYGKL
jgi:outer membrane protein assembly factor BamB